MRRVFLGLLELVMLGWFAPAVFAARPDVRGKTIKDLSDTVPLGILQRSAGAKFYRSLLVSPLDDWSVVRARTAGGRLSGARVIRPAANPVYDSLALKFASDLTLAAHDAAGSARQTESAQMHLLIYRIADGLMAVSFAYAESSARREMKHFGTVRISVKAKEGRWVEIAPSETAPHKGWSLRERDGRPLRRMDRMPMDVISAPVR